MRDPDQVAAAFNESINHGDLAGLSSLIPEDHLFVDTEGERVVGKSAALEAWRQFFSQFPDYRNHIDEMRVEGSRVIMAGHSTCAHPALQGPALWSAVVEGGQVSEWWVHSDTKENRRRLGLGL